MHLVKAALCARGLWVPLPKSILCTAMRSACPPLTERKGLFCEICLFKHFLPFCRAGGRESKITFSSNKQRQEIPDFGWQGLVNNGLFLNVDGRGVRLIVSRAFSISWQRRFCKVRNTRRTLALCYQTQIGHHRVGERSSCRAPRRVQGKALGGLDSLKFP